MVIGESNRKLYLLGRSSNPPKVLSGDALHTITGSDLRLFIPSLSRPTMPCAGSPAIIAKCMIGVSGLHNISAETAITNLCNILNVRCDPIILNGLYTTTKQLLQDFSGGNKLLASDVAPIEFYGGPPNRSAWYRGTLLTFLVDRILTTYLLNKQTFIKWLLHYKQSQLGVL